MSLIPKAIRVIHSCHTLEQLATAKQYTKLVMQACLSPAYSQLITAAEDYFILESQLKSLIKYRKAHM
jgi:hypothetical protein